VQFVIATEYLPDAGAYVALLSLSYAYRFILLQLTGEAREFTKPEAGAPVESLERPQRFLVRKLGKEFLVAIDDIEHLEALGNYVNLHVRGHAYPLRSTMSAMELKLDPRRFVRTHRSHIVNLDFLAEIHPLDSGDATLKLRDGTAVPCSRNYRSSLRDSAGDSVTRSRSTVK
jgi:DNA-binding LytR/AlgR family response regulator